MKKIDIYKLILTTTDKYEVADKIRFDLVSNNIAPCVHILNGIDSTYKWKNKIVTEREIIVLVKIDASKLSVAKEIIEKLHNYECPEIISFNFDIINSHYRDWFNEFS